jgi:glycosyltransferase involved in cell wall biosynthesis
VKHLLLILPEFHPSSGGGICSYYQQLLSGNTAAREEHKITIIQGSMVETRGGKATWNGIDIFYLDKDNFESHRSYFQHFNIFPEIQNHFAAAWAIYSMAKNMEASFDCVITTDWGFAFIPWILKRETPVIIHLHGSVGQIDFYEPKPGHEMWAALYLQAESSLFSFADALVTHSKKNIEFWSKRLMLEKEFSLIPPAFQINKDHHTQNLAPFNHGLVVARIQHWKGPIVLCEAIRKMDAVKRQQLKIFWIGRDTYNHEADCSMDAYLSKIYPDIWKVVVEPLGEKSHEEIERLYEQVSWGLVPSTWDMFNLSSVEHLIHKKPVICSTGAGVSEFIKDYESVVLYDNTTEGLAKAIENMLDTGTEELKSLGELSYIRLKDTFEVDNVLDQHLQVVDNAVQTFENGSDLSLKFEWLLPRSPEENRRDSRDFVVSNWSMKDVNKLYLKRIREKLLK